MGPAASSHRPYHLPVALEERPKLRAALLPGSQAPCLLTGQSSSLPMSRHTPTYSPSLMPFDGTTGAPQSPMTQGAGTKTPIHTHAASTEPLNSQE